MDSEDEEYHQPFIDNQRTDLKTYELIPADLRVFVVAFKLAIHLFCHGVAEGTEGEVSWYLQVQRSEVVSR